MGVLKLKLEGDQEARIVFHYDKETIHLGKDRRETYDVPVTTACVGWNDTTYYGRAYCSPRDQFCRATGKKIALARALREWPRSSRRALWNAFWMATNQPEYVDGSLQG